MRIHSKILIIALPLMLIFLLIHVLPMIMTLPYAFMDDLFSGNFIGVSNFLSVLRNEYYQLALKNTFFFLSTVPVLVCFSLALAFLSTTKDSASLLHNAGFVLPMLLPSVSSAMIFKSLYAMMKGSALFESAASLGFFPGTPEQFLVIILYFWRNSGLLFIIILSGLLVIPADYYESAMLDGAGYFKRFRFITLPLITPELFFCVILGLITNLRIFKETYLLYGAYPHDSLYLVQHYMNNHFYKMNYSILTAASLLFAVMVSAPVFIIFKVESHWMKSIC